MMFTENPRPESIPLVRPAAATDIPYIVEINEQARAAGYSETGFIILPLTAEAVGGEIERDEARFAVAEIANRIIGFVKYTAQSPDGYRGFEWTAEPLDLTDAVYIDKLVVREGYRGHGIGTALYLYVARVHPDSMLYTYVVASPCRNAASVAFHERRGFRAHALAAYETENGSWFRERLYAMTQPPLLFDASRASRGFLIPLGSASVFFEGALGLLIRELGSGYVTAAQLTGHADGDNGSTALVWVTGERTVAGVAIACTAGTDEIAAARTFGFEAVGKVGCVQTLVVDEAHRRRGGGTALARQLVDDLRDAEHDQVLMFTWISGRDDTADGIARALGLTRLGTLLEYWYEDSLEAGYECPVCGNPCRCSVTVWALGSSRASSDESVQTPRRSGS